MLRILAITLSCSLLSGCAQGIRFRSDPAGARISINGEFAGITPAQYEIPEHGMPMELRYRVERGGYLPQEGNLRPTLAPGRLVGAIFTLGIVYAFRNPYAYKQAYDFALEPLSTPDVRSDPLRVDERLRRLQSLLDQGLITQEEYQRQRLAILNGL
jgi:hypothetical protein